MTKIVSYFPDNQKISGSANKVEMNFKDTEKYEQKEPRFKLLCGLLPGTALVYQASLNAPQNILFLFYSSNLGLHDSVDQTIVRHQEVTRKQNQSL